MRRNKLKSKVNKRNNHNWLRKNKKPPNKQNNKK